MEAEDSKRLKLAAEELVKAAIMDAKANSDSKQLADAIQDLKGQTQSKLDALTWEVKKQNLAWAITNADLYSFQFYRTDSPLDRNGSTASSTKVVRGILTSFRQGRGHVLYEGNGMHAEDTKSEESRKAFRDKLVGQIYDLTGEKPVLKPYDSYYAIYMS